MKSIIFQVHEFNEIINQHLSSLGEVIVEGEISELQISQGKFLFMTIKDQEASVSVFAMVFKISGLNALSAGMKVHVYGIPTLYQKTGRFSLQAWKIIPAGEGALRLAYERLKAQLAAEGLFEPERKRQIIKFPERIALLTAKKARAYSDFIKVLNARIGGLKIFFYPINVQGKESVDSILQAFSYFNTHDLALDAIVITRGGGSLEDLLSFNDESVARAIFASKTPVISAIGHEEDIALTDLVADLRASTPSNAAELLVASRQELMHDLDQLTQKIETLLLSQIQDLRESIDYRIEILADFYEQQVLRINQLMLKLDQSIIMSQQQIKRQKDLIKQQIHDLWISFKQNFNYNLTHLSNLERLLINLDYRKVIKRGFSLTKNQQGKIINSIRMVKVADKIQTVLSDGQIQSKVIN